MNKIFRKAIKEDLALIVSIYNEAIRAGFQTADLEEIKTEDRIQWFEDHQKAPYDIFVLEVDKQVVGWLSLSPYRKGRGALITNAEISYYLSTSVQSKGLGSYMMEEGIKKARQKNIRNLIAILLAANNRSVILLQKYGFEEWGRLPEIANINQHIIDHLYFGLKL